MPWFPTVGGARAKADGDRRALPLRLARLARLFPLDRIRAEPLGAGEVVSYYEQCHDAYRKYHSRDGAVHMALNPEGRFDSDGFYGQLRLLEDAWRLQPPHDVLELAFGQGFNLAYLAPRHPGVRFEGLDLTPRHLVLADERLRAQGAANVRLRLGDFHALPYPDGAFDTVFCIEAFCYASNAPLALREAARVLRPGGTLTLFDGYLPRASNELAEYEALAVELVAKGMAIPKLQVVDELLAHAAGAGLHAEAVQTLDDAVMPSLRRLERVTGAVVRWPWLGRRALARRSPARSRNVLAGYLMRSTVSLGLIGYRRLVLRKPA